MSTVPRLPDAEPTDGVKGGVLKVVVAGDEYEPASFVVRGVGPTAKHTFDVSALVTGDGRTFPAEDVDLKVVKVWYQNRNAWYSYFGDCGWKLCPELLLNDEDLIRVDEKTQSNYARLERGDGASVERWINPPRQFNFRRSRLPWRPAEAFQPMRADFRDAKTLQPVTLEEGRYKQFFLTVHARPGTLPGTYRGIVRMDGAPMMPVVVEVLPFTLPAPRTYAALSKEFRVSSYSYMNYENILLRNGYDFEAMRRLFAPVFRNLVAHNQNMYILSPGRELSDELAFTLAEMKKAGLRTDVIMGGVNGQGVRGEKDGAPALVKRRAAAATRLFGHRNVHISYGDEPGPGWMIPARTILDAYKEWGFKTFIAGSDMCFHKAGHIYDWFNVSRPPTSDLTTRLWNGVGADSVAWYANQHVGAEDPSFSRRQNGLGAWLAGYTALCNYAHHFGDYNDDSTTYRPMVYAYGTGDGVIDTLQWEGFREGVDDIRYATLLTALGREAAASGTNRVAQLGRKALRLLVEFDREADSLTTLRGEMVRAILDLRATLGHEAVLPPLAIRRAVEPEADVSSELAGELAVCRSAKAQADVYLKYYLPERAYEVLVASNDVMNAARLCASDDFRRPALAAENFRKAFLSPQTKGNDRQEAFVALLEHDFAFAREHVDAAFGSTAATTNWFASTVPNWYFHDRKGYLLYQCQYSAAELLVQMHRTACAALGKDVSLACWTYALEARVARGAFVEAASLAREALASPSLAKAEPEDRFLFALASLALDGQAIPDGLADACDPKKCDARVCTLGSWVMQAGDEALVRRLAAYREARLKKKPKRRYVVRFSPREILSPADWVGVETQTMDRRYGGDAAVLYTDVATGDRGSVGSAGTEGADGRDDVPEIAVLADAWGLHFRYDVRDAKAAEIAAGLEPGYSWEGYLAPGGDRAYTGLFLTVGRETAVSLYPTSYDNEQYRRIDLSRNPTWVRTRTVFGANRVTTYLSLAWNAFARTLPTDGDAWDYENLRWSKGGDNAWNGTESIHGRSTWGTLVFALPPAAHAAILRRQLFAAKAEYEREKNPRVNGVLEFWADPHLGDPAFYAACVKPLEERLDAFLPRVTATMDDAEVEALAAEALPGWLNLRQTVERLRANYLKGEMK